MPLRTYKWIGRLLMGVVLVLSCERDDQLGLGLVPNDQKGKSILVDTFSIQSATLTQEPFKTSTGAIQLVGSYYDPVFGYARSEIYTQIRPISENNDLPDELDRIIDSVVLSLRVNDYYGFSGSVGFIVEEISQDFTSTEGYYSNDKMTVYKPEISIENQLVVNTTDSVLLEGREPAQLRIPLYPIFGNKLLNAAALNNQEAFLQSFKGLKISMDSTKNAGNGLGGIVSVNMSSQYSRVKVYYTIKSTGEASSYEFLIRKSDNSSTAYFSSYYQDKTFSIIENEIDLALGYNNALYLQSMQGLKGRILVPAFKEFAKKGTYGILKAELELPVLYDQNNALVPITQLRVRKFDENNDAVDIEDLVLEGATHYGGNLSASSYVFNVSRYTQNLMNEIVSGKNTPFELEIIPDAFGTVSGARSIVLGQNGTQGLSLRLYLVKIDS